jgi:hypothetical protein
MLIYRGNLQKNPLFCFRHLFAFPLRIFRDLCGSTYNHHFFPLSRFSASFGLLYPVSSVAAIL